VPHHDFGPARPGRAPVGVSCSVPVAPGKGRRGPHGQCGMQPAVASQDRRLSGESHHEFEGMGLESILLKVRWGSNKNSKAVSSADDVCIAAHMASRARCARVLLMTIALVAAAGAASGGCTRATPVRPSWLVGRRPRLPGKIRHNLGTPLQVWSRAAGCTPPRGTAISRPSRRALPRARYAALARSCSHALGCRGC
jgi:hypothetical protein